MRIYGDSAALSTKAPIDSLAARARPRDILGLVCGGMLLAAMALAPESDGRRVTLMGHPIPSTCVFRIVSGRPCPACGLTRGVALSVRGHVSRAVSMHPLAPLFTAAMVVQLLFSSLSLLSSRVRAARVSEVAAGWGYGLLMLLVFFAGTLRMLGLFPWPPA